MFEMSQLRIFSGLLTVWSMIRNCNYMNKAGCSLSIGDRLLHGIFRLNFISL